MSKIDEGLDMFADSDQVAKETSGGKYLRLKEGQSVVVVFPKKKPLAFKQVWLAAEGKSEVYDADKHDGMRPSGRFMFSVAVVGPDGPEPMILECGVGLYEEIKVALQKYKFDATFELRRVGSGKDTEYKVLFENRLDADQVEALAAVEHHDLDAAFAESKSGKAQESEAKPAKKANPWGK
jgi:frataxin-like iron-binding protein CyaY